MAAVGLIHVEDPSAERPVDNKTAGRLTTDPVEGDSGTVLESGRPPPADRTGVMVAIGPS